MDCSPPGSSVRGISQARTLERIATSFSRGSSWPRDWTHVSYIGGGFFTTKPPGKFTSWQSGNPFACLILSTTCELGKAGSIIPVLQRRTLRLGEVKWFAPGHRADEVVAPGFEARSVWPQRPLSPLHVLYPWGTYSRCRCAGSHWQEPQSWADSWTDDASLPASCAWWICWLFQPQHRWPVTKESTRRRDGSCGGGQGGQSRDRQDSAHPSPGPVPPWDLSCCLICPSSHPKVSPLTTCQSLLPTPTPGWRGAPSQAPSASGPARIQTNSQA